MKRITLILFASMLTLGGFAQTKEFKDVYVTFTNQLQPDDTYMVINSNYPGSGLFIEYEWFIDSPNYTRVLYGQVKWRKYGTHQLIATQNFKESIDYTELESAWEVYLTAYVELDRASYTQLPDFTN